MSGDVVAACLAVLLVVLVALDVVTAHPLAMYDEDEE